jgi:predicted metalloprotease with PDZ domain
MMKSFKQFLLFLTVCINVQFLFAQKQQADMSYTVSMEKVAEHYYHVVLNCKNVKGETQDFKICAWTPGYYQIMDFAKAVENFQATDAAGKNIEWEKPSKNIWRVHNNKAGSVVLTYELKAVVPFVGNVFLDETRGYITPGGLFLYLDNELRNPVTVQMKPYSKWRNLVATGLDSIPGRNNTFFAANFDVLYDSPFLMGNLETLPSFTVKGIPHYFIGYDLGEFDRNLFIADLKKIVETGSNIIGDIPYTHYTFLAIGPGAGGIEHLNSTSLSFSNGEGFTTREGKKRLYHFIAHEYFHNYNVKRIRPVELGPFDYSKENRTNMLWVSEGFTVYYEYLIVRRAGLTSDDDVLKAFQSNIANYENKPGHLYQSATQASHETWSDGPFGRTGDEVNKTISYYDKGPVLGLMLDFKIRYETKNKQSLDDVMRLLYKKYYQTRKRGFTEEEFQAECEKIAGTSLGEVFEYASTVKEVNYPKYFAYAGLAIDTVTREIPGAYFGATARERDSSLTIREVEWNSPAWNAGLRARDKILAVDGIKANLQLLNNVIKTKKRGDVIKLRIAKANSEQELTIKLGTKREKSFAITPVSNPDALQSAIYTSWMKEN